ATTPATLPGGSHGIAWDGQKNVWATNSSYGSNTVTKISPSGAILGTFVAGPASGPTEYTVGPIAISAGGAGDVGDPRFYAAGSITKLDPAGNIVATIATSGDGILGLAIDASGNLWALCTSNLGTSGYVQKYSPQGTLLLSVAPLTNPQAPTAL